ncbi:uncharacterized protein BT62DRAFT_925917 [Guyanagaster necrorhizus]|uniref:Uncharacterized protein n=1 Tax=Guyanagaster necrorhizus TaxID=856835 RepID=A0A9P7W4C8_9AGAR|nr:uncharacterized protein BT62DRAFT_925917 [Guyanagaster necrorhizus MCA 3950]KAG7451740.1 hypothetical protein BT62DRAFT_925917 [Guyanagaster necrorhizus MCA 3950]
MVIPPTYPPTYLCKFFLSAEQASVAAIKSNRAFTPLYPKDRLTGVRTKAWIELERKKEMQ